MNRCDSVIEALHRSIDAGDSRIPVALCDHVTHCARCKSAWLELLDTDTALRSASSAPDGDAVPPGLHDRIMDAVNREPLPPRRRRHATVAAVAAAAAVICVIAGVRHLNPDAREAPGSIAKQPDVTGPLSVEAKALPIPSLGDLAGVFRDTTPAAQVTAAGASLAEIARSVASNVGSAARIIEPRMLDVPSQEPVSNPQSLVPVADPTTRA